MKYFIFIVLSLITFFAVSKTFFQEKSGYLSKNITLSTNSHTSAELLFGSYVMKGRIYGWYDESTGILYSKPDKQVEYALIADKKILHMTKKVQNGTVHAYIDKVIDSSVVSDSLKKVISPYEKKYYETCSTCHAATELERYSIKQWQGILKSMKSHSKMSDSDTDSIYRYIKLSLANS